MIKYYAIRGLNNERWLTAFILKATTYQEAVVLLDQYKVSHVQNCSYESLRIDVIEDWTFKYLASQGYRAFVSKTVVEQLAIEQTKREMLQGAP